MKAATTLKKDFQVRPEFIKIKDLRFLNIWTDSKENDSFLPVKCTTSRSSKFLEG